MSAMVLLILAPLSARLETSAGLARSTLCFFSRSCRLQTSTLHTRNVAFKSSSIAYKFTQRK